MRLAWSINSLASEKISSLSPHSSNSKILALASRASLLLVATRPGSATSPRHIDMDKASVAHASDVSDISDVALALVGRERLSDRLPPHETYEGRHRWDPDLTWTPEEERKVVRKTDFYLLSCLCVMVRFSIVAPLHFLLYPWPSMA